MAITNVNIGELIKWRADVKKELEEVDKVLDDVSRVLKDCNGDDTIYGACKKMGEGLAEAYLSLSKVYRNAMEATNDIIERAKKGVQTIGDKIVETAQKFSL